MIKVLVIEDNAPVRSSLCRMLGLTGHVVLEAASGQEGLAQFRAHRPDVVLTDMKLPDLAGDDVIRILRAEAPELRIIAMSGGFGGVSLRGDRPGAEGADASLHKPFLADELITMIARLAGSPKPE